MAKAWSNKGGLALHARQVCSGLWLRDSGDSKGLPQQGQAGPCISEKSAQQEEQK
jgi:hypothetical protein